MQPDFEEGIVYVNSRYALLVDSRSLNGTGYQYHIVNVWLLSSIKGGLSFGSGLKTCGRYSILF